MNLYYCRCLLNYVSRMSKRVIPKSFSFHMFGSLYYQPGIFPSSSFYVKSMRTFIREIKTKLVAAVPCRISSHDFKINFLLITTFWLFYIYGVLDSLGNISWCHRIGIVKSFSSSSDFLYSPCFSFLYVNLAHVANPCFPFSISDFSVDSTSILES